MIAACPECRTQYRVDPQRLTSEGVRLRCTRCQTVFRVRAAQPAASAVRPAPAARPTAPEARPAPPPPLREAPPLREPPPPARETAPAPAAAGGSNALSERLVLVATPDADKAKDWSDALRGWGLEAETAHDGVEALLKIHRRWPSAVVMDPQLPKMFGFQVCEVIKRNDSLRRIGVVLIGAIHHPERYRRGPAELYGADAYVEEPDLPEALAPILRDMGLPIGPGPRPSRPAAPRPAPAPLEPRFPAGDATMPPVPPEATLPPWPPPRPAAPPPPPQPIVAEEPLEAELSLPPEAELSLPPMEVLREPVPPARRAPAPPPPRRAAPEPRPAVELEPEPAIGSPEYDVVDPDAAPPEPPLPPAPRAPAARSAPAQDPDVVKAERLARIIVSDVVLYNEEKFRAACAAGNVMEVLEADLADGRAHFASRVPEHVRSTRDFLGDELLRVARSRGMA